MIKRQLLAVFILLLVPLVTSSLLDLKHEKEQAAAYEALLAAQEAQRVAEKKNYLLGKFEPAERKDFVLIPAPYRTNGKEMYLHKDTYEAFQKMAAAAELDGIRLRIASATRNFEYQKGIWEAKWSGASLVNSQNLAQSFPGGAERFRKILEYSAAPGTSRHHWGSDIDINYAVPAYFETGQGKREYEWLAKNASFFGFCQTYVSKNTLTATGYHEEKWHWSYLPLAKTFTAEYAELIKSSDISGFLGEEYTPQNLIRDYVLGINPECL